MPTPEPPDEPAAPRRRGRRVSWRPAGNPGDGSDTVPESDSPQSWGDAASGESQQSNDDRLTTDKPPHWG